jgi:MFS family permease
MDWIFLALGLGAAIFAFVSALFPEWNVRWGRHGVGPPMTVAGRIATGCYFICCSLLAAFAKSQAWVALIFVLFVPMFFVYRHDKRIYENSIRAAEQPTSNS